MANFCTNCGNKIRKEDNFCTNCGNKINKSDIKQNNTSKLLHHSIEKDKEREEEKKLEILDEIFESEETKSEIRENNIDPMYAIFIKGNIKDKLINKKGNMIDGEIEYFIKTELKKAIKEQRKSRLIKEKEMRSKEENNKIYGNECDSYCRHCFEEIFDGEGGIVGDYTSDGYSEYYCNLGHSISFGSFCEDYE